MLHRVREPSGEAQGALVLFHGRGADESDLFPLFDVLDPQGRFLGLAPRGPLSLPPGGAHWYVVRAIGYPDKDTFEQTFGAAAQWLDDVLTDAEIPPGRSILGGFSQGAVMSYALGLGRGRPRPAGLMAFSGFMPNVDGFDLDLGGLTGWPVVIGHGTHDPVIGVEWGRDARDRLQAAAADVSYRESPMGHSIDPVFLRSVVPWVARTIHAAGEKDE
jgi:phospholipase/carboxylesterase